MRRPSGNGVSGGSGSATSWANSHARALKGTCNTWGAYLSTRTNGDPGTYTDYAASSARDRSKLIELASGPRPMSWTYNYNYSQRARYNPIDLPGGGSGFLAGAFSIDSSWSPLASAGVEFVPHLTRSYITETEWGLLDTENPNCTAVMGPTEPDADAIGAFPDSVANVLSVWPRLSALATAKGWRLGAPTVSQTHAGYFAGEWFDLFWQGLISNDYRLPDFIPLHYFGLYTNNVAPSIGSLTVAGSVAQYRDYILRMWDKYQRPLWCETALIQAAPANWPATPGTLTATQQADYLDSVTDMFWKQTTSVVERWSYWPLGPNPYSEVGLYDTSGTINTLGTRFKAL